MAVDWTTEALPVLEAVGRVAEKRGPSTDPYISQHAINEELNRPQNDPRTDRALYHLTREGYLRAGGETDTTLGPIDVELAEKGLQITSGWPGGKPALDVFLAALETRIEQAATPEERSRLQRAYDGAKGLGREVFGEVISMVITGQLP